jgi:nicotinamide phosphoribosyltransferase
MENFLFLADSYKVSHHLQYPPGTETVFSYFESRGGKWDETLFFGLQYILKKHLVGAVVTQQMVEEADSFYREHFGADIFNRAGWEHIVTVHGGRLPLEVRAVPEGTVVPTGNVLFTVENTDPKVPIHCAPLFPRCRG